MTKEATANGKYKIGDSMYDSKVYDKYLGNMRLGLKTLYFGSVSPFTGFPDDQNNGISLRLFYTDETIRQINERLLTPIEQVALENNIPIFSGLFWTLHTSVSDLRYLPAITTGNMESVFEKILENPKLSEVCSRLKGIEFDFDTLFGGSNITLASCHFPDEIVKARSVASHIARELNMGEKQFEDIVHITLARIADFPINNPDLKNFYRLGRALMKLQHTLVKDPIQSQVEMAEVMTNKQMDLVHQSRLVDASRNS